MSNPGAALPFRSIESCVGRKAELRLLPMEPGEIETAMAGIGRLEAATGYRPAIMVEEGVRRLVDWCRKFYRKP
jgi:UDP-glucuronate 4-epimerase